MGANKIFEAVDFAEMGRPSGCKSGRGKRIVIVGCYSVFVVWQLQKIAWMGNARQREEECERVIVRDRVDCGGGGSVYF